MVQSFQTFLKQFYQIWLVILYMQFICSGYHKNCSYSSVLIHLNRSLVLLAQNNRPIRSSVSILSGNVLKNLLAWTKTSGIRFTFKGTRVHMTEILQPSQVCMRLCSLCSNYATRAEVSMYGTCRHWSTSSIIITFLSASTQLEDGYLPAACIHGFYCTQF